MSEIKQEEIKEGISSRAIFLGMYFLSLPLGVVRIPYIGGSALKFIALLPVGYTVIYLIYTNTKFKLLIEHFVFIALFFSFLISAQFSVDKALSYNGIITSISMVLLFIITTGVGYNKREVNYLVLTMRWASRITALLVAVFGDVFVAGRVSLTNSIFQEDPNYLIGYFLFGIVYCLHSILDSEYSISIKLINVVELSVYLYILLLTGSRGGAVGVIICVIAYIGLRAIFYNEIIRMFGFGLGLILIIAIVIGIGSLFIPLEVIQRFTISAVLESGGTGRYALWENLLLMYQESTLARQIIGYGSGTTLEVQVGELMMWHGAHNFWLEKLLEIGFLGFLVNVMIAGTCIRRLFSEHMVVYFAIYAGILSMSMSLALRAYKPWWNLMILLYIVSEFHIKNKIHQNKLDLQEKKQEGLNNLN